MELSDVFYENCVKRFIYNKNVKIFKGNSRYDLYKIISNISVPITFWLDSHWSGVPDVGCDKELLCPLLHELEQIKNHHIKTHTIMVDDIRLMDGIHFEVRKEQIEKKILEINPNYKLKYYNDAYAINDVLVAYIDIQVNNIIIEEPKICIHKYLSKRKTNEQPPGLADFIRGSIALFNYSKKYNYDFCFDDSHPIFDNLLKNNHIIKNTIFDDTIEILPPKSYEQIDTEINALFSQNKSFCVMTNAFYTKNDNGNMENFGEMSYECKKFLKQIFTPNQTTNNYLKDVYKTLNLDSNSKYNIIHLRLGDNFIWNNTFDNNLFNNLNEKIKYILSININKQFVLLSDSAAIAVELKKHNPELFYWDNKKIHIGDLKNTNVQQAVTDTLIDFFIMTNCDKMFCYAFNGISGFSKLVSLIYDKEFININNMDTSQLAQNKLQEKNINMSIHTIGDSHSYHGWSGIISHHLGPVLCFSFGKKKLNICDIRNFNIKDNDSIVFCFGEIDCRCHIHKHITDTITYQDIINNIVDNYFEAIELNVSTSQIKLKNICVYNVVPPIQKYNTIENTEYPFLGTDEERKKYTLYFNKKLKKKCIENNYIYFDIYDKYIDENGFLKKELSDNTVHINNSLYINNFIQENKL
jgi:hypothetical protein